MTSAAIASTPPLPPAGDWSAGDVDGDGVEDQLVVEVESDYRVKLTLVASGGAQQELLRTEPFEHPLLEMCGVLEDLTDDDRGEFILTTRVYTADGGSLYRARLYCGSELQFLGQVCFEFDPSGSPRPSVLQMPGDVDGDGSVGVADIAEVASEVARQGAVPAQLGRLSVLAADLQGDGAIDMSDLSRVIESAIAGPALSSPNVMVRLEQLIIQPSSVGLDIGAILRALGRLIGIVDCVACADNCAESLEEARRFVDEFNESFEACRHCLSTGDCPPEEEIVCDRLYRDAIVRLSELAKAAGGECGKCIRKCAGKLRFE